MKSNILNLLSRHQVLVSFAMVSILGIGSATYYFKDSFHLTASITAASCYLQPEIDKQQSDLSALYISASTTLADINNAKADIVKNSALLTATNASIASMTSKILSDFSISTEKAKTDTLYSQLNDRKALDTLLAQAQSAKATLDAAKKASDTLSGQVSSAKNTVNRLYDAVRTEQKKANTTKEKIKALVSQYNSQVAIYNSLNSKYNTALAQLQTYSTQYNTLATNYNTASAQYKSKYNGSTTAVADLQKQYDVQSASYNKLVSGNDALKSQLAKLNADKATYTALDTSLPEKVAALEAKSKDIASQIADAANALAQNKSNICPEKETLCSNLDDKGVAIDDDRNGVANCDDAACAGDAACQVTPPDVDTTTYGTEGDADVSLPLDEQYLAYLDDCVANPPKDVVATTTGICVDAQGNPYPADNQTACLNMGYCDGTFTTKDLCTSQGRCVEPPNQFNGQQSTYHPSFSTKISCETASACMDAQGYIYPHSAARCSLYGNCTKGSLSAPESDQQGCVKNPGWAFVPYQYGPIGYAWQSKVFGPNVWADVTPKQDTSCGDPIACNFGGTKSCHLAGCEYNFTSEYTVTTSADENVSSANSSLASANDASHNLIAYEPMNPDPNSGINSDNTSLRHLLHDFSPSPKEIRGNISLQIKFGNPGQKADMHFAANIGAGLVSLPVINLDTTVNGPRDAFNQVANNIGSRFKSLFHHKVIVTASVPASSCVAPK